VDDGLIGGVSLCRAYKAMVLGSSSDMNNRYPPDEQ